MRGARKCPGLANTTPGTLWDRNCTEHSQLPEGSLEVDWLALPPNSTNPISSQLSDISTGTFSKETSQIDAANERLVSKSVGEIELQDSVLVKPHSRAIDIESACES
jgi:hypothetical protein